MRFLKVFFFVLLILTTLEGGDFREVKKIELKKDEIKKILVKYDDKEKLFKFRWTLFTNGALVVFHSYDRVVAQSVLYKNYKNQSFRVELKTRGADFYNVPYFLIKFKKFDYEKQKAIFELLLSDENMQVELKYLKE